MPQNFHSSNREQLLLLPPSIADWLPPDHLAHFIVECVESLKLDAFYNHYRADGKGGAAYEPFMLVSLLLYCYAIGLRSSRQIERSCIECVPQRFITGGHFPDHSTISRFRKKFQQELEGLFVQVLSLCNQARLVKLGAIAVDGTKVQADAALDVNYHQEYFKQLAKDILAQAEAMDAEEDEQFGEDKRGDEPPDWMKDAARRRAQIKKLNKELEQAKKAADKADERIQTVADDYDQANDCHQLPPMISQCIEQLTQANIDASQIKAVLGDAGYWGHRVIDRALDKLNKLSPQSPAELIIAVPAKNQKLHGPDIDAAVPGADADIYLQHEYKQRCRNGQRTYRKRSRIESVFAQIKNIRQISRFIQRGMANVKAEWSLACTTHNLLKLWRHKTTQSTAPAA